MSPGRSAAPSLEVVSPQSAQTLRIRLHGETNSNYSIETSTNLVAWQSVASVQTTNGLHDLSFPITSQGKFFVRASQEVSTPTISLGVEAPENLSITSLITPEGGSVELRMPDLRLIVVTFPTGAVFSATEIKLSVVTNFTGLPFAAGAFGGVKMEPEGLMLMGAGSITIDCLGGTDPRTVLSFTSDNDGNEFFLAPDRALTNEVLIPFTRFATYGSAVVSRSEVEALIGPLSVQPQPAPTGSFQAASLGLLRPQDRACVRLLEAAGRTFGNADQFRDSAKECFPEGVLRALGVQRELEEFLECGIRKDLTSVIAVQRQQELLIGREAGVIDFSGIGKQICDLYQQVLAPLWVEATNNCSLGTVLMQFMLNFERQMSLLGMTNAPCNYTLGGNLDKLCANAKACIEETRACCALGHRGQQKYFELVRVVRQLELIGAGDCLPREMDEPIVLEAADVCLTNTWFGSFSIREYGDTTKITTSTDPEGRTAERKIIDLNYQGAVYKSDESMNFPGIGKILSLTILGEARVILDDTFTSDTRFTCGTNPPAESHYYSHTVSIGKTNGTYDTNLNVAFGAYSLGINLKPDNKTYEINAASGPFLTVKVKDLSYGWSTSCSGQLTTDKPDTRESSTGAVFPGIFVPIRREFGADTNTISGTYQTVDESGEKPIPIEFRWNFHRVLNR